MTYIFIYIHVYVVCICTCTCTYVRLFVYVCVYIHVHTYIYIYIYIYRRIHIHTKYIQSTYTQTTHSYFANVTTRYIFWNSMDVCMYVHVYVYFAYRHKSFLLCECYHQIHILEQYGCMYVCVCKCMFFIQTQIILTLRK